MEKAGAAEFDPDRFTSELRRAMAGREVMA
jgi:hypothetical protein